MNIKIHLKMAEVILLVSLLVTREAVAPLANDYIILWRSIWLFFSSNFGDQKGIGATCKSSYHVVKIDIVI